MTAPSPAAPVLRAHAEQEFAEELHELIQSDERQRPPNWKMSPWAVATYLLGGTLPSGFVVSPKYIGDRRLIEIAIATLTTDRALLLLGVPGTAKCVKHDMLVMDTRTGERITIAEACQRQDIVLASLQGDLQLRPQRPTNYLDNGVRPCYRVTTRLGREVEVTLNHPFLTVEGWQPLANLSIGDRIALPRSMPFFGTEQLSDAHVKVLAHLIAEGNLTQSVPHFCNMDSEIREDFSSAVAQAFPELNAKWHPDGKNCSISGGRRGPHALNPCTKWLRDLGLMGTMSGNKFVPDIVFGLPSKQIALFLSRLFAGDGCLQIRPTTGQVTIDYCSKSKRLVKDVQHLLLRFGINSNMRNTKSGHYRLYIQGTEPCITFLQEIGWLGPGEAKQAIALLQAVQDRANPNVDTIPFNIWPQIEDSARAAGYRNLRALAKADRGTKRSSPVHIDQNPSRARVLRLSTLVRDPELQRLAQSDIYWDPIVSIEPIGEHQVYDLSMADTHNFVVNDIIVHNSYVSEHLTAAISGNSTLLVQGTAGTSEESVRYGWNYARLLAEGPSEGAVVGSPIMRAMREGRIARVEELTRIPADVQDSFITILSEKTLPIPELNSEVQATKGFNVIATANNRDRGVNELSSALKRRFNTVILPLPDTEEQEVEIVRRRVESMGRSLQIPAAPPAIEEIRRVVAVFRELRSGVTADGKTKIKSPSGTLSTAEAISVMNNGLALAAHFGDGSLTAADLASGLTGAVIKDPVQDTVIWQEYLETVVKERDGWKDLYRACREQL